MQSAICRTVYCTRQRLHPKKFINLGIQSQLRGRCMQTSAVATGKLSEFQMKKITQEFDHMYDGNKDGIFDKKDVERFKGKLREYVTIVQGKAVKDPYGHGYDDYWSILLEMADTNRDGLIQREEWIDQWTRIVSEAKDVSFHSLPQWVRIMPGSIFPVIDSKGDGHIDPQEYKQFWYHVGGYPAIEDRRLLYIFDVMTEEGKYKMDVKRVQDLYADFYLSDDPKTPGRYIAGPIPDFD